MSTSLISPTLTSSRRHDALHEILNLLRTDWTREHLLGYTPMNDAAILSSPLQQLHSVSFESNTQFDPLDSDKFSCNAIMSSESVFIPAFSKDGWNAGFIVEESYGLHPSSVLLCPTGSSTLRFLANETDGTFIGIIQHSNADIIWHFRTVHRSNSCICLAFPPNTLVSFIGDGINDFERALHSSILCESTRSCAACATNGDVECPCIVKLKRSKNPLDLGVVTNNMIQVVMGQCAGTGFYESFDNGVSKQIISIGSQRKSLHLTRQDSVKKLIEWAIGDVLKTVPTVIHRSITAPFDSIDHLNSGLIYPEFEDLQNAHTDLPVLLEHTTNRSDISSFFALVDECRTDRRPLNITERAQAGTQTSRMPSASTISMISAPSVAGSSFGKRIAPRYVNTIQPQKVDVSELSEEMMKKSEEDLRAWKTFQRKIRNRESAARSRKQRQLGLERQKEDSK